MLTPPLEKSSASQEKKQTKERQNSNGQYPSTCQTPKHRAESPKEQAKKDKKRQLTHNRPELITHHVHKVSLPTNPPSAPGPGTGPMTGIGQLGFFECPPPILTGNNGGNPSP